MRYQVAQEKVYRVEGNEAVHLPDAGYDLSSLAAGGNAGKDGARVALDSLTPGMPIAKPGKVICLGLNYADHAKEAGRDVPDYPVFFMRGATSLMGASAPMVRPAVSDHLDYEAEIMLIIGRGGRNIPETAALDHVFGYTLFNDGSVRDYQKKSIQWTAGKNFDSTGPVGPIVVTPDELPAGCAGLNIQCRVNGEVVQNSSTNDMLFSVARTIATISEFATLEPGDMVATGTPPGVGMARTPPLWLKPGDVCEVEVERIGILRSDVVAQ